VDITSDNIWRYVLLCPGVEHLGHWSTGNAWTAVATFRILRTIRSSQHNRSMISEEVDLINWIKEIHDKMYKYLYACQPLSTISLYDAMSIALMTSAI